MCDHSHTDEGSALSDVTRVCVEGRRGMNKDPMRLGAILMV